MSLRIRSNTTRVPLALFACAAAASVGLPLHAIPHAAAILENCMISG
jgi:hypothetical protein